MERQLYLENLSSLPLLLSSFLTCPSEFGTVESVLLSSAHLYLGQVLHDPGLPAVLTEMYLQILATFCSRSLQVITAMAPLHTSRGNSHIWICWGIKQCKMHKVLEMVPVILQELYRPIFDPAISPKNKAMLWARENSKVGIIWLVVCLL